MKSLESTEEDDEEKVSKRRKKPIKARINNGPKRKIIDYWKKALGEDGRKIYARKLIDLAEEKYNKEHDNR